jgi:hypothetical protein
MTRIRSSIHNAPLFVTLAIGSILAGWTAWLLACGPFVVDLEPVLPRAPADKPRFALGELGVVRPAFDQRYLIQAYRTLSGRSPARGPRLVIAPTTRSGPENPQPSPIEQWADVSSRILGTPRPASYELFSSQSRRMPGDDPYQTLWNCTDEAFDHAMRTLRARIARFGPASSEVSEWTRAQAAVFDNCHGGPLVLPEPAANTADVLIRADRAYQTAAAYFYAVEYAEAERRFRAIAADATSPWRPYGRYLAARANIRLATVGAKDEQRVRVAFATAEEDLRAVLADADASPLHRSARGLIDFLAARIHPVERLHELSKTLSTSPAPGEQDFVDYRFVLSRLSEGGKGAPARAEIVRNDDLTDWLLTFGGGDQALARPLEQWKEGDSAQWLVAALWQLQGRHPAADAVLDAARRVDRRSPAFPTVAFLRVHVLAALGRRREARDVLASLPVRSERGFGAEAVNLVKAERLMLAETFDQFLANATRTIVTNWTDREGHLPNGRVVLKPRSHDEPVLDEDASITFTERLPLDRLVEASLSKAMPSRLRLRAAMAAWTRAILLQRDDAGARLVPVLRELAPPLRDDLDRYARAGNAEDRHRAGVFLWLNTPGAGVTVRHLDDDYSFDVVDPAREFDHVFRRNWGCGFQDKVDPEKQGRGSSEVIRLLYADSRVPYPVFVTAAERSAVGRELRAIVATGAARSYLAVEAIRWAEAKPDDPAAAQALAQAVEGWRWGCGDDDKWEIPRRAFTTLHRLFPKSDAAERTPYWYRH